MPGRKKLAMVFVCTLMLAAALGCQAAANVRLQLLKWIGVFGLTYWGAP